MQRRLAWPPRKDGTHKSRGANKLLDQAASDERRLPTSSPIFGMPGKLAPPFPQRFAAVAPSLLEGRRAAAFAAVFNDGVCEINARFDSGVLLYVRFGYTHDPETGYHRQHTFKTNLPTDLANPGINRCVRFADAGSAFLRRGLRDGAAVPPFPGRQRPCTAPPRGEKGSTRGGAS